MEDSIHNKHVYKSDKNTADGFLDETIYDEKKYRQVKAMEEESKNNSRTSNNLRTKKQKDYAVIKAAFIKIIISGVLFLLIYCLAEFKPSFIPFTIKDVREALADNLFSFIK